MACGKDFAEPALGGSLEGQSREISEGCCWSWIVKLWPSLALVGTLDQSHLKITSLGGRGRSSLQRSLCISLRVRITTDYSLPYCC